MFCNHWMLHVLDMTSNTAVSDENLTPSITSSITSPKKASCGARLSIEVMCRCNHDKPHLTPIRLHLRDYFTKIGASKNNNRGGNSKDKRKVKPLFYGQVLSSDIRFNSCFKCLGKGKGKGHSITTRKIIPPKAVPDPVTETREGTNMHYTFMVQVQHYCFPLEIFSEPESEDDDVCCECQKTMADVHWVACDECDSWYHLGCTDLTSILGADDL